MKSAEGSEGLLGDYDFLILDEAHDFPLAAMNGLEFEVNPSKLQSFSTIGMRLGGVLAELAASAGLAEEWHRSVRRFEQDALSCQKELQRVGLRLQNAGIVAASPEQLGEHELVKRNRANLTPEDISELGRAVEACCATYSRAIEQVLAKGSEIVPGKADELKDSIRNYRRYLDEFAGSIHALVSPRGVSVTHAAQAAGGAKIRFDTIGIAEPLDRLLWKSVPTAFLSATLAVDESFEFFRTTVGLVPEFAEILSSPFDYSAQAAIYLPKPDSVPDPTEARKSGSETDYYRAVANELSHIISVCEGRTLALFHSRKEMEAVASLVPATSEHPILVQSNQSASDQGETFKRSPRCSLFALRSFWTGFDAPGSTLSCVVLVRIPFEVPVDPPQIARAAHLQSQGLNPFASYSLPMAKMLVRQGAGRLIRSPEDRGIIAILDPRIRSKRYGEEFLNNLPAGMQVFSEMEDAANHVGLEPLPPVLTADLFGE